MNHPYIKKIILRNFRSHEKTVVELSPGMNAIVGPSGSGKSSILRALQWVFFNEPRGTDYIQWGKDSCYVKVILSDGAAVTRTRTKAENSYTVRMSDGKTVKLQNLPSKGPPALVRDVLGIGRGNVRWQHEGPFLLSESPKEVSDRFAAIVQADLAAKVEKALNSRIWTLRAEARSLDSHAEEARHVLSKKSKADLALRKAEEASRVEEEIDDLRIRKTKSVVLVKELRKITTTLSKQSIIMAADQKVREAEALVLELSDLKNKGKVLEKLTMDAKALINVIGDLQEKIEAAQSDFMKNFPPTCPLCGSRVKKEKQ